MAMSAKRLIEGLKSATNEAFNESWRIFLFNVTAVRGVTEELEDQQKHEILAAGAEWKGGGWNSTTARKKTL